MKSKKIEVKAGNVKVTIYIIHRIKHGRQYVEYKLADRTMGTRRFLTFKNEVEARQRAGEIAQATHLGQLEAASWTAKQKRELTDSMDLLRPYGITVRAAVTACCHAMQIIKTSDSAELLVAAQFYRSNRPDKPLIAKLADDFVDEYLSRRKGLSAKRQASLACLLGHFAKQFSKCSLDQVEAAEIADFIATKTWKPKTVNDFLGAVSLLFKDAILHNHAALNPAAPDRIRRHRQRRGLIEIYEPGEVRTIMSSLEDDLVVAMALWFWGATRISEVARLDWSSLRKALKTGYLVIEATEGGELKTEGSQRSVPVIPTLRAWIEWYLAEYPDASGLVLPSRYSASRKLDNLPRKIASRSKLQWRDNAPRHSFCTYFLKISKDIPKLVEIAGNSIRVLQKHYWNKSNTVTEEVASQYFDILPPVFAKNLIPMPQPTLGVKSVA